MAEGVARFLMRPIHISTRGRRGRKGRDNISTRREGEVMTKCIVIPGGSRETIDRAKIESGPVEDIRVGGWVEAVTQTLRHLIRPRGKTMAQIKMSTEEKAARSSLD